MGLALMRHLTKALLAKADRAGTGSIIFPLFASHAETPIGKAESEQRDRPNLQKS